MMPELDILNKSGKLDEWSPARLFAIMLHPKNTGKRSVLIEVGRTQHPFEGQDEKPSAYRMADHAFKDLTTKEGPAMSGRLAGAVLFRLKQIFDHPQRIRKREPSLDQAFAIVAEDQNVSHSKVNRAWRLHKSVSPYWAAFICTGYLDHLPDPDAKFVRSILVGGKAFLKFARGHSTGRGMSAKPILTAEEVWLPPFSLHLDKAVLALPPLSDDDIGILRAYKARSR